MWRSLASLMRVTPHPRAAVVGLHEQRVAHALGDRVEVELLVVAPRGVGPPRVVRRVLERHEHRLGHLEPQAHHRAVGRVLLHALERERAVEQVHVVHERDLLEPLARHVVPVREPVDHQVVAGLVAQVERLDGDPLDVEGVLVARARADRPQPLHDRLERLGPVLLGAEQQPDQMPVHVGLLNVDASLMSSATGGARAGGATTASRARRRGPTRPARAGCPSRRADRRARACSPAPRWCPPTCPGRRPA